MLFRRLARFCLFHDRRATVALELTIFFPIMLMILTGFYETYIYLRTVSIMERTAMSLADLIARRTILVDCATSDDSTYLGTYMTAAEMVAQPLTLDGKGEIFVSAINAPSTGKLQIAWQRRSTFTISGVSATVGKTGATPTLDVTLPLEVGTSADTAIVVEVVYRYTPFAMVSAVWSSAPGTQTLRRQGVARARYGSLDTLSTESSCSSLPTP